MKRNTRLNTLPNGVQQNAENCRNPLDFRFRFRVSVAGFGCGGCAALYPRLHCFIPLG
ncbi:MAG: hypothetical protein LBT09_06905 [Planctomycetaceae bacterium]|jgi:hypothetical protein|nr:hypothetical protein [Planctomycetaceae bacterium]